MNIFDCFQLHNDCWIGYDFAFHPIILNLIQAVHGNFLSILTGHFLILSAFVQGIISLFF